MDELRRPLFAVAAVLMVVIVGLEISSQFVLHPPHRSDRAAKVLNLPGVTALTVGNQVDPTEVASEAEAHPQPPGAAIPDLALIDGLLVVMVVLTGFALRSSEPAAGAPLGPASLTAAMVAGLAGIFLVDVAVGRLRSVVALYLSPPSGTLIYLALFGFFDRRRSFVMLGGLIALKLVFWLLAVRADRRFGQNRLLVGLVITSVITTVMVSVGYGVVPPTMASVTDAIAAVAVSVVGLIWAVLVLVRSMTAVIHELRSGQAASGRADRVPG